MINTSGKHIIVVELDRPETAIQRLAGWLKAIDTEATYEQLPSGRFRIELRFEKSNRDFANRLTELEGYIRAVLPVMAEGDQLQTVHGVAFDIRKKQLQKSAASTVPLASF